MTADAVVARFEANRPRLVGLAYRMLGDATEAEDIVQDAYLRWDVRMAADEPVQVPEAWLTTAVTNLCLNRLTSARAQREQYIGPWLPTPVFTTTGELGPLETLEQRDTVSMAMLTLLERLTPPERAVFVLREAFGHSHREIGTILDLDEANVRQLYRRAQSHLGARRRFAAEPEQHAQIVTQFLTAAAGGDIAGLERLLAEDATAWADGGGKASAARRPILGRNKVARYFSGLAHHPRMAHAELTFELVNGETAMVIRESGQLTSVLFIDVVDGQIVGIRTVVNPDKLAFAARQKT